MSQTQWTKVDEYFETKLQKQDPVLEKALAKSDEAGLPAIQVAANQGAMLKILAMSVRATRILEVGTLGGYSTIWLARALPDDGRLLSLELEDRHAKVARANIAAAGLSARVEIRVGPALATLAVLAAEKAAERFDFVFIDADKANNAAYFEYALGLSRPGTLIVVDNVVRDGKVIEPVSSDPSVLGVRKLVDLVSGDSRCEASVIQTVGTKGYDGFLVARVRD